MTSSGIAIAMSIVIVFVVVPLLRRITARGHTPRLAVFCWLSVSLTVYASWAVAGLVAITVPHGEPVSGPLHTLSIEVTGLHWPAHVCYLVVGLVLLAPFAMFVCRLARICVVARRGRERRRVALQMLGEHPVEAQDVSLVRSDVPMVYCMPGKPHVIVVTTAVRDSLPEDEFQAVLEHERAHLSERHHILVAIATAIGLAGRRIWLFRSTQQLVRDLVEMRADDVAVRRFGPRAVAGAIGRLSAAAPPSQALGAGPATAARVLRISDPPSRGERVVAGTWSCFLAAVCCSHLVVAVVVPVIALVTNDHYWYDLLVGHAH